MADDNSILRPQWPVTSPFRSPRDSPPPAAEVQVEFGARSRPGPLRSVNEDHYLIQRLGRLQETLLTSIPEHELPQPFFEWAYGMVVADGLGNHGETASRLAISTLVHLGIYFGKWNLRVDEPIAEEIIDRAKRFYRSVDAALSKASVSRPRDLQTTMTAVFTAGSELIFAHVGHSRAYVFRDHQLFQLTHDHTIDRDRVGKPTIVDLAKSPRDLNHILTESLGGSDPGALKIDVERCGLLDGDLILLCTNGLTDVADDERIAQALRSPGTPDDQCRALVDLAFNSGSSDDVTAIVAHYSIPA